MALKPSDTQCQSLTRHVLQHVVPHPLRASIGWDGRRRPSLTLGYTRGDDHTSLLSLALLALQEEKGGMITLTRISSPVAAEGGALPRGAKEVP